MPDLTYTLPSQISGIAQGDTWRGNTMVTLGNGEQREAHLQTIYCDGRVCNLAQPLSVQIFGVKDTDFTATPQVQKLSSKFVGYGENNPIHTFILDRGDYSFRKTANANAAVEYELRLHPQTDKLGAAEPIASNGLSIGNVTASATMFKHLPLPNPPFNPPNNGEQVLRIAAAYSSTSLAAKK